MRALAATLAGMAMAVLPATTALAAGPEPDIAVTSVADKAGYAEGDTFVITVTVKNESSVAAKHVHYTGGDSEGVDGVAYGVLSTGFDLAAGATRTVQISGRTNHRAWRYGSGYVALTLAADNGEADDADNSTIVRLRVPGAFANLSGYVFQNESFDAVWTPRASGVPGVKVVATTTDGKVQHGEAVTDAKGMFRLRQLPAGDLLLTFSAPAGWKILAGENGEQDNTLAQAVAGESDEPSVHVPAKKIAVTSPSASPSVSATGAPGVPIASPSVSATGSPGLPNASPSTSATGAPGLPITSPSASATAAPGLPITGDNTMLLIGAGAVAVAAGGTLVLVARRRRVHLHA